MTRLITFSLLPILAVASIPFQALHQEDDSNAEFKRQLQQQSTGLSPAEIDEIVQIRQQLRLESEQPDSTASDVGAREFGSERSTIDENAGSAGIGSVMSEDEFPLPIDSSIFCELPDADARIAVLRNAAREIDRLAADLEDANFYSHADQLRVQAQQLRMTARCTSEGRDPGGNQVAGRPENMPCEPPTVDPMPGRSSAESPRPSR